MTFPCGMHSSEWGKCGEPIYTEEGGRIARNPDGSLHTCWWARESDLPDDAPEEPESLESQIDRLAQTIMQVCPGEPSRSEGAVDTAIRLLTQTAPESEEPDEWHENFKVLERAIIGDTGQSAIQEAERLRKAEPDLRGALVEARDVIATTVHGGGITRDAFDRALARANAALGEKEGS